MGDRGNGLWDKKDQEYHEETQMVLRSKEGSPGRRKLVHSHTHPELREPSNKGRKCPAVLETI